MAIETETPEEDLAQLTAPPAANDAGTILFTREALSRVLDELLYIAENAWETGERVSKQFSVEARALLCHLDIKSEFAVEPVGA